MEQTSLINHLVFSLNPLAYNQATHSPFLTAAAHGKVSPQTLGKWLANDRLYIHSYIAGAGRLLSFLQLPTTSKESDTSNATKLLDWTIEALANIRREEKFFMDTAARYGIAVDMPASVDGSVSEAAKSDGLVRFEHVFGSISRGDHILLPWLEAAVVFYATEKCYLDAWSGAKAQLQLTEVGKDADGGALREEFIPNWSSTKFKEFVDRLGGIIDDAIQMEIRLHGEGVRGMLFKRAEAKWLQVLVAEQAFWPQM